MTLRRNILANYLGQGWSALMGFAFIPVYIKYLGIEAYGLIGIFAILQAWFTLFDMGITPTLSREMARFTGGGHEAQSIANLLRTIEIIGLFLSATILVTTVFFSNWIASDWLKVQNMPMEQVSVAISLMGVVVALKFIENIYRSSLIGLQKQVMLNAISALLSTCRGLGAIAVLAWVSPTIQVYFLWQGLISLITVVFLGCALYRHLPNPPHHPVFSLFELKKVWKFALGILGITFLSLLLSQVDKILLSKFLSLKDFGYYSLAALLAGMPNLFIAPIVQAFYPKFVEYLTVNDQSALIASYHKGAQLISILMGSSAIILIFYSHWILQLWTADNTLAATSAPLVVMLAIGGLLSGLMWIPYQMQLAYGWTSLSLKVNSIAVIFIVPGIYWAAKSYGALGAAFVWAILNFFYVMVAVTFMYRKILTSEMKRWYLVDVLAPILSGLAIAGLIRYFVPDDLSLVNQIFILVLTSLLTLSVTIIATPLGRHELRRYLMWFSRIVKTQGI